MQECGATRPRLADPGWECTGRDLIVVTHYAGLPIVLPARALDVIEPERWWDLPIERFAGGDHLHLVAPKRPQVLKTDGVMTFGRGAEAYGVNCIGPVLGSGVLYVGGPF